MYLRTKKWYLVVLLVCHIEWLIQQKQWEEPEVRARPVRIVVRILLVAVGLVGVTLAKCHAPLASILLCSLPMAAFSGGLQMLGQSVAYSRYIVADRAVKLVDIHKPGFGLTDNTGEYVNRSARALSTIERSARFLPFEGSYAVSREVLSVALLNKPFAPAAVATSIFLGTVCQGFYEAALMNVYKRSSSQSGEGSMLERKLRSLRNWGYVAGSFISVSSMALTLFSPAWGSFSFLCLFGLGIIIQLTGGIASRLARKLWG